MLDEPIGGHAVLKLSEEGKQPSTYLRLQQRRLQVIQLSGRCGITCEAILQNKEAQDRRQICKNNFVQAQAGRRSRYIRRPA